MEKYITIIKYGIAIIIVAIIGGVAGWFFYIRSHQSSITSVDQARGLTQASPSFDGASGSNVSNVQASTELPDTAGSHPSQQLWRADIGPVAGFSFITSTVGSFASSTHLYFAERANGYIFDADAINQSVTRLTNTLIPKTYEAVFAPKGSPVALRTLEGGSITTLLASFGTPASTSTFPQTLAGPTLPSRIRSIAIDRNAKQNGLFYLVSNQGGGVTGFLSTTANGKPKQIFSSSVGSWRAQLENGTIYLLENASDGAPGYAYTLSNSGTLNSLAGPVPGLMILPHPTGNALAYSGSSGGRLFLYAKVKNASATLLSVQTIAEKCVWAPNQSYILFCAVPKAIPASGFIDSWYQGALHTIDSWWMIDTKNGTANQIFASDTYIDVHDPQIDSSGSYIAFTNGADESLWVLHIVQ
jgi:hypothetical protein